MPDASVNLPLFSLVASGSVVMVSTVHVSRPFQSLRAVTIEPVLDVLFVDRPTRTAWGSDSKTELRFQGCQ